MCLKKTKILQEAEHYCKLGKDQDGFQLKFIDTIIGRPAYNRFCIPFNRLFCRDLTVFVHTNFSNFRFCIPFNSLFCRDLTVFVHTNFSKTIVCKGDVKLFT